MTMRWSLVFVVLLLLACSSAEEVASFSESYQKGVEAYLANSWGECVLHLRDALERYKRHKGALVNCRQHCHQQAANGRPLGPHDAPDGLPFYDKLIRNTLCLMKCKKQHLGYRTETVPDSVLQDFEKLKPYDYLQLCYFKTDHYQLAASAAFTFLEGNPSHKIMTQTLQNYLEMPEVKAEDVINYEVANFLRFYVLGAEAYEEKNYSYVAQYMEESVSTFLEDEEECRMYCEGPFDQGWHPDFVPSVANHFTFNLKCKKKCYEKLCTVNGGYHEDLFSSHYHYLQYAYHKVGDLPKAASSVASYLLFHPADEVMLKNKEYYSQLPQIIPEYFKPRKEAVEYKKRHDYETAILKFISEAFQFGDSEQKEGRPGEPDSNVLKVDGSREEESWQKATSGGLQPPPLARFSWVHQAIDNNVTARVKDRLKDSGETPRQKPGSQVGKSLKTSASEEQKKRLKRRAVAQLVQANNLEVRVVQGESELGGPNRFVADGLADRSECNRLLDLVKSAAVQGDGYRGRKSPHTDYERFEGVTVGRATLLTYLGIVPAKALRLYLDVSSRGRDFVERYFNLKKELLFTYTHLVCRTALPDAPKNRTDLSHAIHADNCNLHSSGKCPKEAPAYTWRDYSAIIYLNENFDGGEFIFTSSGPGRHVQSRVKPGCGRLVGFSAGVENPHGVEAVHKGSRCALAMWFTLEPRYDEVERKLARQVLAAMEDKARRDGRDVQNGTWTIPQVSPEVMNQLNAVAVDESIGLVHSAQEDLKGKIPKNLQVLETKGNIRSGNEKGREFDSG